MYQCLNLLQNKNKQEQHKQLNNFFEENLNSKVFQVVKWRMINNKNNINIMRTILLLKMNPKMQKMILLDQLKNQEMWERNLPVKKKQHQNLKQICLRIRKYQINLNLVNGNKFKTKKKKLCSRGQDHQIIKAAVKMFLRSLF